MHEYYSSHYHRGYGGEPGRASPRLLDNRPRSTRVVQGLPGPDCSGQNPRGRPHHAGVIANEMAGEGVRSSLDDAVESEGDDPFGSLGGAAGRPSPPGRTLVPFYIGETVTQTSPTSFAFSRRRRGFFPETPPSDSEAECLERRSSSTTTFSEEDFQISYQKVRSWR